MTELPARIKRLGVTIGGGLGANLVHESIYSLEYLGDDVSAPSASLLMPRTRILYRDGELFPSMDMNLPEGYLFQRLVDLHPKQPLSKMHLLALMGRNGIGRVGFVLDGHLPMPVEVVSRETILRSAAADGGLFAKLVRAYLSTGAGISGVQPKIMVPTRAAMPIPDLIVKTAGPEFPHLAINEFLCLTAAKEAGIPVPVFELSDDGAILVLERFDIDDQGRRLGFEDMAALMGLRVNDRLSSRKYHGSYEAIAEVIQLFSSDRVDDLRRFFHQLTLSIMVRNGDAHLKNFGLLHSNAANIRLSPVFDVVTTTVYRYERPGGALTEDRTLALKWRRGRSYAAKSYPTLDELVDFGRYVCQVTDVEAIIARIAQGMRVALARARTDDRVPPAFLASLHEQWEIGLAYDRASSSARR